MIIVQLTNGFGNNIFQYVAGRQLADIHNKELSLLSPVEDYYGVESLRKVGAAFTSNKDVYDSIKESELTPRHLWHLADDENYKSCFHPQFEKYNFKLIGYFEDYTFYINNLDKIKTWFSKVEKREDNDLVIHFRTGDTLFQKNNFKYKPSAKKWVEIIEKFDFEKLHIVSDFPSWQHTTKEELETMSMKFHNYVEPNESINKQESADYINSCIDEFSKYDPIFKHGKIHEDFDYVRSFNNILFQHGTFGWWAAALSDATRVGVYGPWRPWKGDKNKNLSNIPLKGWFKWE